MAGDENLRAEIEELNSIIAENEEALGENAATIKEKLITVTRGYKKLSEQEKSKGVKASRELHTASTQLEDFRNTLTDIGYTEESGSMFDFLNSLAAKKQLEDETPKGEGETPKPQTSQEIIELKKILQKEKREREALENRYKLSEEEKKQILEQKQNIESTITKQKLEANLTQALKDEKGDDLYFGTKLIVAQVLNEGLLSYDRESKRAVWNNPDDPDLPIEFEEGLEKYLSTPDMQNLKKDKQKSGAGSSGMTASRSSLLKRKERLNNMYSGGSW